MGAPPLVSQCTAANSGELQADSRETYNQVLEEDNSWCTPELHERVHAEAPTVSYTEAHGETLTVRHMVRKTVIRIHREEDRI